MMTLAILSLLVSVAVLVYAVRLSLVYHRFNEQIRSWAESIDDTMRDAINRSARNILRELDKKIEENNNKEENKENEQD